MSTASSGRLAPPRYLARARLRPLLLSACLASGIASLFGGGALAQDTGSGLQLEDLAAFPTGTLEIRAARGTQSFDVWIANTPAREEQGLMFVRDLPPGRGMLFVEREPRRAAMWMKNTYIELDMVFIRADGRIASIARRTVPHSLKTIAADEPVKAVLEIRGGESDRLGLKAGDLVQLPAIGSAAAPGSKSVPPQRASAR